jgi:hypothetical protein
MRRVVFFFAIALPLGPGWAGADEVHLRGGGRITGEIVEQRPDAVVIEVGPGRVTLPASRIERIVSSTSPLAAYRKRASQLLDDDVRGWLRLGFWARDQGLNTQAREAFQHVLSLDPESAAAQEALGRVFVNGQWMSLEDSYRARGLALVNGTWMTPAEREAAMAERAAEADLIRARSEADARSREAEARAAAAEAEARRIEAQTNSSGFPYPWIFGGGGVVLNPVGSFVGSIPPVGVTRPPVVVVPPAAPPPPPMRDGGGHRGRGRETNRNR